jgi:hypothetical protein
VLGRVQDSDTGHQVGVVFDIFINFPENLGNTTILESQSRESRADDSNAYELQENLVIEF